MDIRRLIVLILGVVAVVSVAGGLALTVLEKSVPDSIIALGSASIGAIASFLVQAEGNGSS